MISIRTIKLENFRSFNKVELEFKGNFVIIQAPNASGKTTVLEAINILANGSSEWSKNSEELINYNQKSEMVFDSYFRISGSFVDDGAEELVKDETEEKSLFNSLEKREFFLNNKRTTKRRFMQKTISTVFSPEVIDMLMDEPQKRREYIDRTISLIDYEFAGELLKMNKLLKQRNSYLKKLAKRFFEYGKIDEEDSQLKYWSQEFYKSSEKISESRRAFINSLSSEAITLIYQLSELKDQNIKRDIVTGRTNQGAHRDDWQIHTDKNVKKFGSRGEKRMAVVRLLIEIEKRLKEHFEYLPILLLDDMISELDKKNSSLIMSEAIEKAKNNEQQVFLSITDASVLPKQVLEYAEIINLLDFKKVKELV